MLERLLRNEGSVDMTGAADKTDDDLALDQARLMLQFVRVSRALLPGLRDLADHPGWEIVLHIFVASREDRTVTTSDLCELTGTWRPLAMRYVEMLFERGLIDREVTAEKPEAWALSLTSGTEARLLELLCGFAHGFAGFEAAGPAN